MRWRECRNGHKRQHRSRISNFFFRVREHIGRHGAVRGNDARSEQLRASFRRWLTPIGQKRYSATELKCTMKKVDFFPRAIDFKASLPFYQAWSRASKKVGVVHSIDQGPKKSESEGAFYDTLAENGPFPHTNESVIIVVAFKVSVGKMRHFSSVSLYKYRYIHD